MSFSNFLCKIPIVFAKSKWDNVSKPLSPVSSIKFHLIDNSIYKNPQNMDLNMCLLSSGRGTKSILYALENGAGISTKMKNTGLKILCTYLCWSYSNKCFMCIILFISLNILVSLEFGQRSRITVSNIRDLFEWELYSLCIALASVSVLGWKSAWLAAGKEKINVKSGRARNPHLSLIRTHVGQTGLILKTLLVSQHLKASDFGNTCDLQRSQYTLPCNFTQM